MICSHFLRSQAKLVLVVPSMRSRAAALIITIAQHGEALEVVRSGALGVGRTGRSLRLVR